MHLMLVFCLVTAGISPACKFIAGKADLAGLAGLIEICTPYGVQKMAVNSQTGTPVKPAPQMADVCGFCLAAQSHKADGFKPAVFDAPVTAIAAVDFTLRDDVLHQTGAAHLYRARAPPFFS